MERILWTLAIGLLLCTQWACAQGEALYVCDAGNFSSPPWQILRFDAQGQDPHIFTTEGLAWPQDILFLEDQGVALVSNLNSGTINRHDAATGELLGAFATGLAGPTRMAIGPDSLIHVLQWSGDGRVLRFRTDGTPLGPFSPQGVPQGIGLAWDSQGRLYVSSYSLDTVRRFAPDGTDLGTFIQGNLVGPTNIWFDESGDLLVSDYDGGSVKRFGAEGAYEGVYIGGLGQCEGVAHLPDGGLLLGNGATGSVRMYDGQGSYLGDWVSPGAGGLIRPNAVVWGPAAVEVGEGRLPLPDTERILQWAWPNPFNPDTILEFHLPEPGITRITLHDLRGAQVRILQEGLLSAGGHRLRVDGQGLGTGVYLSRITCGERSSTERLVLVK